jgi:hypothetical protein
MPSLAASSRLRLLPKSQSLRMWQAHSFYKDHCDGSEIVDIWTSLLIRHALTKFATTVDVLESSLAESITARP